MGRAEPGECDDADGGPPLTVELLADLQAGLLDDDTAARLRKRVRADPDAQRTLHALNRVRRNIAALGTDASAAPDVSPTVISGIGAALRSAQPAADGSPSRPRAAHAVRPRNLGRPARIVAAEAGLAAAAVAIGLGTAALLRTPAPMESAPTTAQHITVSRPRPVIPLSDQQILALLEHEPDYGPLADPERRASCLKGLGYPASTRVLGARPVEVDKRPGVLLVLPGDRPGTVAALAVTPRCNSTNTGLLADRVVDRP
jgi:hypothetical protein